METIQQSEIKANKPHICNYCGGEIAKGEQYLRSVHKYEGEIYTWKAHKSCQQIASDLQMFDNADEGVTMDYFIEQIRAAYRDMMIVTNRELYESEKFTMLKFREQLEFVKANFKTIPI